MGGRVGRLVPHLKNERACWAPRSPLKEWEGVLGASFPMEFSSFFNNILSQKGVSALVGFQNYKCVKYNSTEIKL